MEKDERYYLQLKSQLSEIEERRLKNQMELAELERIEENMYFIKQQSDHLFDRLFYYWHKDRDLMNKLQQEETQFQFLHKNNLHELASRRLDLLKENRHLDHLEYELYKRLKTL